MKPVRSKRRRRDSGVAVMMALILIAVLSIGSAAVWKHMHRSLREIKRLENEQTVCDLAESGLEKAVIALRRQPDEYRGEADTLFGEGRFSVEVKHIPSREGRRYEIAARGELLYSGVVRASRTLDTVLVLGPDGGIRHYHSEARKKQP
jgi:hypothetical protein